MKREKKIKLDNIKDAIKDIKAGKLIIVVDDENRENEGDLICAAEKASPWIINFMTKYARGLICVPLLSDRLEELELPQMVNINTDKHETAFTVSVDARKDTTTGISAYDRAITIKTLIDKKTCPKDLRRPGHIFPLKARSGGVLRRAGHTEAAVDFAKLAGLYPAGVICEILNDDGSMARLPQLRKFADKHKLKLVTIKDLITYRLKKELLVKREAEAILPTIFGEFKVIAYKYLLDDSEHVAIIKGQAENKKNVLVRMHSQCLTGDVIGSLRCDCRNQLHFALKRIAQEKKGVVVYLSQEGRGIGLANKIKAYELQDKGLDTVDANIKLGFAPDLRDYGVGAQILVDLGLSTIRLLTNNPKKIIGLEGYGIKITKREPILTGLNDFNKKYIQTKKKKLGHLI